jgi:hypothetical protein
MAAHRLIDENVPSCYGEEDDDLAYTLSCNRDYPLNIELKSKDGDKYHRAYLTELREEAECLVSRHWSTIAVLAAELLEHETLDGGQIKMIVDPLLREINIG